MRGRPVVPVPQGTPIYDRLYAEFQETFRTLPGDRSGEEGLGFNGFAPWTDASNLGLSPSPNDSSFHRHDYASRRGPTHTPTLSTHLTGRHRFALPPGR